MHVPPTHSLPQTAYACGFSLRKRNLLRQFLPECTIRFVAQADEIHEGAVAVVWGSKSLGEATNRCSGVLRIEDGFLRSVGLGADLVAPMSWVVDGTGIYYDATRPSDLEYLLEQASFGNELIARAKRFRPAIVEGGITKYNVGAQRWRRPSNARKVVLVPGQVEQDASILYASTHQMPLYPGLEDKTDPQTINFKTREKNKMIKRDLCVTQSVFQT